MSHGLLAMVLHAHLPYVRHPEHKDFLEERWLFEAVAESYVPILQRLGTLATQDVRYKLTISVSPPLASMLEDELLQSRLKAHLERCVELANRELVRVKFDPCLERLARLYLHQYQSALEFLERNRNNLIIPLKALYDSGHVELISSAATHAYLPLIGLQREAVRAQVFVGVAAFKKLFHRRPKGFWLPECGFAPGDDEVLKAAGIEYFIVESHGIMHASARPKYGIYAPVYCPSGVAAFGRDPESSKQVWSADEGYPGDYWYREFYRDIGFELEDSYIRPYVMKNGTRVNTGFKYYRITGKTEHKELYDPEIARNKALEHAANFCFNRSKQTEYYSSFMDRLPIVVAPYDAELFGHWWYEGPQWLESVIRELDTNRHGVELVTLSEYLERYPVNQVAIPSMSSWGWKGYNEVWLNGSNDWIYPHLHLAASRMAELANTHSASLNVFTRRLLNQAARELLLAQSSDWPFMMKTGSHTDYAVRRITQHISNFNRIYDAVTSGAEMTEAELQRLESCNGIFPFLDYSVYSPNPTSALSFLNKSA